MRSRVGFYEKQEEGDAKSMKRRGSMSGLFRGELQLSVLIVGYIGLWELDAHGSNSC